MDMHEKVKYWSQTAPKENTGKIGGKQTKNAEIEDTRKTEPYQKKIPKNKHAEL